MDIVLSLVIIFICCIIIVYSLVKQIDELKKDIEDITKYMTDMEIRLESLFQKGTKGNRR